MPLLLCHRLLDGGMETVRLRAAVFTEWQSEQALARNLSPGLQVRRQPADWHGAGGHTWSKDLLLLRALPLKERFTIIDAVSKPTPPRLRSPIGARGVYLYSMFLVCAEKGYQLLRVCVKGDVVGCMKCL